MGKLRLPEAFWHSMKIGFLVCPLLGIYRFAPINIMLQTFVPSEPSLVFSGSYQIGIAVLLISVSALMMWTMNVFLLGEYRSQNELSKVHFPKVHAYALSYLFAVGIVIVGYLVKPSQLMDLMNIFHGEYLLLFPLIGILANNTIILIILNLIITRRKRQELEIKNMKLKMANVMAERAHLNSQLQPHFLFNSLSTLKMLVHRSAEEAEHYIMELSGFMRRALAYAELGQISAREEVAFCRDYLSLQKIRYPDALQYSIDIPDAIQGQNTLPIFCLQLLAENAMKHNGFSPEQPLSIEIQSINEQQIEVRNNLLPQYSSLSSTGLGLANLSERFRLLGGKSPVIRKDETHFVVVINLLPI